MDFACGTLVYAIANLPGAGTSVNHNCFVQFDLYGNRFLRDALPFTGPNPPANICEAFFVPEFFAYFPSTVGVRVTQTRGVFGTPGRFGTFRVNVENSAANVGDEISGLLYVRIWNRANMAI